MNGATNRGDWARESVACLIKAGILDVGDGYRAKNSEMGPDGLPFARAGNINGGFKFDDADILSAESVMRAREKRSNIGDVTFTSKGTFGRFAYVAEDTPDFIYSPQLCYWRVHNTEILDSRFLYYWMQSDSCLDQMRAVKGATDMADYVSLSNQRSMWIDLPPLDEQRRIAGILSAYDDLIENCQRRIRILEEMARRLYREWFVHFRYPGHESIPMQDSPLGPIPQGWEVKPLGHLIAANIGGGWGKDVAEPGFEDPAWVIRGTDIPAARNNDISKVPFRYHSSSNLRSRRLEEGDIIFEVSGGSKGQPVGRSLLVTPQLLSAFGGDDVICASFCKRVRPADATSPEWLWLSLLAGYENGEIEQFQVQSTGISNFKWTEYLAQTQRAAPPPEIRDRFTAIVQPLVAEVGVLGLQSANLRRTRDLLLPRLMQQ